MGVHVSAELTGFFWRASDRTRLEMLNLSQNRLSRIAGIASPSLPALIALNLGKPAPWCVTLIKKPRNTSTLAACALLPTLGSTELSVAQCTAPMVFWLSDMLTTLHCRSQPSARTGGRRDTGAPQDPACERQPPAATECTAVPQPAHSICGQQFVGSHTQGTPVDEAGESQPAEPERARWAVSIPCLPGHPL